MLSVSFIAGQSLFCLAAETGETIWKDKIAWPDE